MDPSQTDSPLELRCDGVQVQPQKCGHEGTKVRVLAVAVKVSSVQAVRVQIHVDRGMAMGGELRAKQGRAQRSKSSRAWRTRTHPNAGTRDKEIAQRVAHNVARDCIKDGLYLAIRGVHNAKPRGDQHV